MSFNLISIILPVHNQSDHIEELMLDYDKALTRIPIPCEFILVVNNSQDQSFEVCQSLSRRLSNVKALNSEKGGWGWAVKLGLTEARGDVLCYTNSARTRPQELQLFLLYAIANPDNVIKANRKFRDNFVRRLGSLLYNLEVRMLFNMAYWDINGTPKVFPRSFAKLMNLKEDGDLIDAEFNVLCHREKYPVLEVPVVSVARRGGKSTTGYYSALKLYLGAYQLWRRMREESK
jgi:glycosyltransferase involved in cell wall biosynthesis